MRALARSDRAAQTVQELGATAVRGDLSDTAAMRAGAEGAAVFFHAAQHANEVSVLYLRSPQNATYVLARMHLATRCWLDSGRLADEDERRAHASLEEDHAGFRAGLETVKAGARLTALGRAVLDGACRYMEVERLEA